ncbi:hypothetical protein JCM10212_003894 [Sporobolomyces blumeae]
MTSSLLDDGSPTSSRKSSSSSSLGDSPALDVTEPLLPRALAHTQPFTFASSPSSSSSSSSSRLIGFSGSSLSSPAASPRSRRRVVCLTLALGVFVFVFALQAWTGAEPSITGIDSVDSLRPVESNADQGDEASDTWRGRMDAWREWVKGQSDRVWSVAHGDDKAGFGWDDDAERNEPVDRLEVGKEAVNVEDHATPEAGQDEEAEATIEDTLGDEPDGIDVEPLSRERILNVRPFARPPSDDPTVKYLSFENHSGFHNQRKSLVNALVLARLLNRTLALPPARLGSAIPWGPEPDLTDKLVFSEECKAGLHPDLAVARSVNSHLIALQEECDDPNRWTYVGWSWLIDPALFESRQLVDRWNASSAWFVAPVEQGGLGLSPEEIHAFTDTERRSYQIYDDRSTPTQLDQFQSRIDLDDLLEGPLADARLLKFGSLFSGARLNLAKAENQNEYAETFKGVVIQNEGLDEISDEVRDRLGSFVSIHARTGGSERGSVFYKKASLNMVTIFRRLTHEVLGMRTKQVNLMVDESTANAESRPVRRSAVPPSQDSVWGDAEDDLALSINDELRDGRSRRARRSLESMDDPLLAPRAHSGRPSKPLHPTLHCRKALWPSTDPILSRLNTPLYIATDSRSPTTDPSLRIFFDWFPCTFLLSDFVEATPGVSDEAVPALRKLVKGGEAKWKSDFDGQEMAKYLYPFLEAEIAARAVETVGTPQSTFSGYTTGILHENYAARGKLAPWDDSMTTRRARR